MTRCGLISVAFLFVPVALIAQNGWGVAGLEGLGPNQSKTAVARRPGLSSGCPISLRAQQAAGGELLKTGGGRAKGQGQGLHVTVADSGSKRVAEADVAVRGLTPVGRIAPVSPSNQGSSGAVRSVVVKFSPGTDQVVSADLWVPGLTSIQAIELKSVTYADGSRWKLPSGQTCRIAPDGTMLVSNR